jgi:hypothetical protein
MNENFRRAATHIGWGDPGPGSLWFVGIEETLSWRPEDLLHLPPSGEDGATYDPIEPGAPDIHSKERTKTRIPEWEAKIASKVSRGWPVWREYRKHLCYRDTKVFSANVFPLGKKNVMDWPQGYRELFGLGPEDWDSYVQAVRTIRYATLRKFKERHQPAAIVAFGKSVWSEFRCLFELNESTQAKPAGASLEIYDREKVILCPFFGYGHMTNQVAEDISDILRGWGIFLP